MYVIYDTIVFDILYILLYFDIQHRTFKYTWGHTGLCWAVLMLGDEESDRAEGDCPPASRLRLPTSVPPGRPLLGLGVAEGDLPAASCWVSVKVTNLFWSPCADALKINQIYIRFHYNMINVFCERSTHPCLLVCFLAECSFWLLRVWLPGALETHLAPFVQTAGGAAAVTHSSFTALRYTSNAKRVLRDLTCLSPLLRPNGGWISKFCCPGSLCTLATLQEQTHMCNADELELLRWLNTSLLNPPDRRES